MRPKIEINAARESDLRLILSEFGLTQMLDDGTGECASCLGSVSWDNLGGIVVLHDRPVLFCNLFECIEKLRKGESDG